MLHNDAQQILAFLQFNSRSETGPAYSSPAFSTPAFSGPPFSSPAFPVLHFPVPHFPVLHFSTLEIWSLIFQSYRSLFDVIGPSLVTHFPIRHFQSTRRMLPQFWELGLQNCPSPKTGGKNVLNLPAYTTVAHQKNLTVWVS